MSERRSNLLTVGRTTGVFGVKGWVKIKSFTEPDTQILEYAPWWLKTKHGVKQVSVAESQVTGKGIIVRLEGVEDRTLAEDFIRWDIAVEKDVLPELGSNDYYWHQLVGLEVFTVAKGSEECLGKVDCLMETGANDVLVIKPTENSIDDRERLVPYVPDVYVKGVELENNTMFVDWDPEF